MGRLLAPGALLVACGLAACATADGDPRTAANAADGKTELYWTSFKATTHGQMSAEEDEEVIQGAIAMGGEVCDPQLLDTSRACTRPDAAGDLHEIRCRMQCKAHSSNPGPTLARGTLFVGGRPVTMQMDRAEMVTKP